MQQMHPMLNVAIKAAQKAGQIINNASRDVGMLNVSVKGINDFVTEVDRASEEEIISILLSAFPDHGILAEESGTSKGNPDSPYQWIIDPLDGTTNFIHGVPFYCVSIALRVEETVVQAVIYDPNRDELFRASKGKGAFVNNRRMRVSGCTDIRDSLIGTGFPFRNNDDFDDYLKIFATLARTCIGLRRPGAAALDMAYVASGRYDAFFEKGVKPWDIAAGSLLVQEAGGLVADYGGDNRFLERNEILAGTPKVFSQLVKLLQPYAKKYQKEKQAVLQTKAVETNADSNSLI